MYKHLVAGVLGLNGSILLTVGGLIAWSAPSQLELLGLDPVEMAGALPTYYGLGVADGC